MSRLTLDELQGRIASVVDQDPETSNIDTDDYALRRTYLNMAQHEWQEAYDWQALYKEFNCLVSTSAANASIALPADFRRLASYPRIGGDDYAETRPQEASRFGPTDKRVEVLGNPGDAYTLRVYGTTLASGTSVTVPYYASAGSLSTSSDISMVPNADYLVKRAVAYVLEAREDGKFPQMKQEAERILSNMLERENVHGEASTFDRVRTVEETRFNFRMGRD